ncbi:MAG: redoxin domain-containing protein [Candidatus Hydrogenedentes bacterium]|nr:redoxin domain-containing protein [Candidatus Hydrogenedentota bacterium]
MKKRVCCAVLFVLPVLSVLAQAPTAVDPKVKEVLDSVGSFYKGLNTVACTYALALETEADGKKNSLALDFAFVAERPNKVSFVQVKSQGGVDVVSDGSSVTVSIPKLKKYAAEGPADSIGSALEWGALNPVTQFNSILGDLLSADPAGALLDGTTGARYVGEEDVDGQKLRHIVLTQDDMDVGFWFQSGEKPYLTRVLPDLSKGLEGNMKVTLDIKLTGWTANEPIPADRFTFRAPEGFEKAVDFTAMFGSDKRPADALVGGTAPTFSLKSLDGGTVDLQSYLGKNILVLDFWATWCGPCVMSLPILTDVTEAFKDKGVVFVGVNQGEGAEEIKAFLSEQKLAFNVALDTDAAVAGKYMVNGIPQTVIIGKSGKVEAVHVGVSPVLRQQLKSQLGTLTSGKSLLP